MFFSILSWKEHLSMRNSHLGSTQVRNDRDRECLNRANASEQDLPEVVAGALK
jgi:hypothetical protein